MSYCYHEYLLCSMQNSYSLSTQPPEVSQTLKFPLNKMKTAHFLHYSLISFAKSFNFFHRKQKTKPRVEFERKRQFEKNKTKRSTAKCDVLFFSYFNLSADTTLGGPWFVRSCPPVMSRPHILNVQATSQQKH